MDARLHANPPTRLIPSARTVALLSLGIGIGIVAEMPISGGAATAAVVAVLAALGAAGLILLRPANPAAVVTADVLLGLAVAATVFGRLGLLYVPMFLAFLGLTARIERTLQRSDGGLHWEPAPEFEGTMPASVAAPVVAEHEVVVAAEVTGPEAEPLWLNTAEPDTAEPAGLAEPVMVTVIIPEAITWQESEPAPIVMSDPEPVESDADHDAPRHHPRHRAPSPARRVAAVTARAGRRLGAQARTGAANLRAALAAAPPSSAVPVPDPVEETEPDPGPGDAPSRRLYASIPDNEFDDLRHEFEERELELVAAGKPWSSLTHRAYGELRFLPAPPPPPPAPPSGRARHRDRVVDIDDAEWETPTWKGLGEH